MDEADGGVRISDAGDNSDGSGNNELLVELAQRLLSWRHPGDPRAGTARLLPGEVPAEVLAEVSLPQDNRIIGSLVLPTHVTVVMESGMGPDQVETFYKERMAAAGWTQPEPWPGSGWGGFQYNLMEQTLGSVFCRGPRGPELRIQLFPDQGALTEVRLHYNTDARTSICSQSRRGRMPRDMGAEIIPELKAPSGSVQIPKGGSSGGTDHRETAAMLKSNLDLTSVAAHHGEQLKGAGWQEQESGESGPMAWSTYAFRDEDGEDWNALFHVVALPKKEGVYHLFVQATVAGSEERYPGGFVFS